MTDDETSHAGNWWAVSAATVALIVTTFGCQTNEPKRTKIVVPSAATSAPEYEGDGSIPEQRYVIRMSNGEQDWEVEFPAVATGYEMHIPLEQQRNRSGVDTMRWEAQNMTEADRELLEEIRRQRGDIEREGAYKGGENVLDQEARQEKSRKPSLTPFGTPQKEQGEASAKQKKKQKRKKGDGSGEADASPYRPSYLLGLQEVKRLYKAGNYELAMVRLVKLEEAYGADEKILSMKGTLWLKLGRTQLARQAWEQVLEINPNNQQVIEALKRLNKQQSE